MRVAVAGSGRLAATLTQAVVESGHTVVAVVQNGRMTRGLRRHSDMLLAGFFGGNQSMLCWARRFKARVVWLDRHTEAELAPLREARPDLLLVGGFSVILRRPILDLPAIGCVNVHSSLLPRHRGPNPFQSVILNNEPETGVTFHIVEEGIDTGDILDQTPFALGPRDTMLSVYRRACEVAGSRVAEVLDRIEREGLHGTPQDSALATYDKKCTEADAWIDWRMPAEVIARRVRAMAPQPMPRFLWQGREVRVMRVKWNPASVDAPPGTILSLRPAACVATGQGSVELTGAFVQGPVPWVWPAPWSGAKPGMRLQSPA